jgi:NAD(P)-dependent dehydrogenase (short-subunit alcohol dehydrogenase family)
MVASPKEIVMNKIIVITGASSGFGALTARVLARAGHTVYASMRGTTGRNAPQVAEAARYAAEHGVDLRTVELDVASTESVEHGIATIIAETGRIDVVIHNAGHMSFGPAEAFTPEQFAELYDINVLSTQRVNRAALPHMRKRGQGLVVWVSSSSTRGGTPPYLSPYFAAKAAMDSLAVSYASELTRWGIETSIIVPGAFTKGTNHFVHAGAPADVVRAAEYNDGPYAGVPGQALKGLASLEPVDADVSAVADAIVRVVDTPFGKRPFRTHIDPSQDGAEIVNGVADRVRAEMFRRIGLEDLLSPRIVSQAISTTSASQ